MVLVDTSVWIDFFRPGDRSWIRDLTEKLESERVGIVAPVVAELLYGARGEKERSRILDLARSVTVFPTGLDRWIGAGKLGRSLRRRGLTLSIVDCLVAEVARERDIPLWTLDPDFDSLFDESVIQRYMPTAAR